MKPLASCVWVTTVVSWVTVKTNTRSKNSSSIVTRAAASGVATRPGTPSLAMARFCRTAVAPVA